MNGWIVVVVAIMALYHMDHSLQGYLRDLRLVHGRHDRPMSNNDPLAFDFFFRTLIALICF